MLVDFTNFTTERTGLHVEYYIYYATITLLLRGQCTVYYASLYPLGGRSIFRHTFLGLGSF